jgi:hypothetical protein
VGASTVTIVGGDGTPIRHPRKRFGERSIDYRHYRPELAKKPQAVRQVLPDLLRDLGDPFPAVWAHFHAAHPDREAARLFAKVLGQVEAQGVPHVARTLNAALIGGTPLLLATAPPGPAVAPIDVPAALRDLDGGRGCAADYDTWLAEATV